MSRRLAATYILPIRWEVSRDPGGLADLTAYLAWLSQRLDVVVVDGSPTAIFRLHAAAWGHLVSHVPVDSDLEAPNGKVGGVLTGVRRARHERLVIADEDVRYDDAGLRRVVEALDAFHVVRPQNHFQPMPWHARWDTARSLINRVSGGDWPGTLGVRRSILQATGGYDGAALFENLELVRTVLAAGGREHVALGLFVARRPPDSGHFWSQRVRQAYDEFARPRRLLLWLSLAPITIVLCVRRRWDLLLLGVGGSVALAEGGRRRAGGRTVFPASASLFAPLWLAERAATSWIAVGARLARGGVRYRTGTLSLAATPMETLRRRYEGAFGADGVAA